MIDEKEMDSLLGPIPGTQRARVERAAEAIEGCAVLLPHEWDTALRGYTVPEGTRLAVGIYGLDAATFGDLDREDALIDALRNAGEVKPIIMRR